MFVEQLISTMWMGIPILVLFFVRIFRSIETWAPYTLFSVGIVFGLAALFYGLSVLEVLALLEWTGLLFPSLLMLGWLLFGQICFEMGPLGGISSSKETFAYGSLCGLWASVLRYREQPRALCIALSGAVVGRIGLPMLMLFPNAILFVPLGLCMGVFFLYGAQEEEYHERNDWLWGMGILVWTLSWYSPAIALLIGCGLGLLKTKSIPAVHTFLPLWVFSVYASSSLAGIGLLELLSRYMEGGMLGEQEGLLYDVLGGSAVISLVTDPITHSLLTQGIVDRGLDVHNHPIMHTLFMGGTVGMAVFAFYSAQCLRSGWKELLQILAMMAGYVFVVEVWL